MKTACQWLDLNIRAPRARRPGPGIARVFNECQCLLSASRTGPGGPGAARARGHNACCRERTRLGGRGWNPERHRDGRRKNNTEPFAGQCRPGDHHQARWPAGLWPPRRPRPLPGWDLFISFKFNGTGIQGSLAESQKGNIFALWTCIVGIKFTVTVTVLACWAAGVTVTAGGPPAVLEMQLEAAFESTPNKYQKQRNLFPI